MANTLPADGTAFLLDELHALRTENRELRRKVRLLTAGRQRWRSEARAWQWAALQMRADHPQFPQDSPQ